MKFNIVARYARDSGGFDRVVARLRDMTGLGMSGTVLRSAMRAACSSASDAEAAQGLRALAQGRRSVTHKVLYLLSRRQDFLEDRAYRILQAALSMEPVEEIAVSQRPLFAREEALGRVPVSAAFDTLCSLEPRLRELPGDPDGRWAKETLAERKLPTSVRRPVGTLVGRGAERDDPLLRSNLAISIVEQHLFARSGVPGYDESQSYFAAPRRRVVLQ